MEILIILILIIMNGIFAMAEIAIISAKKSRLKQMANEGSKGAQTALDLATSPNKFLSTAQIGITFVGIFAGVFGGAEIAKPLSTQLQSISYIAQYSESIALTIVVIFITYLSLVIGELVPKRIALSHPENTAKLLSRPMNFISDLTSPLVGLLSISTDFILNIIRFKPRENTYISEDEVKSLIKEGAKIGVFEIAEQNIVERTFKLSDKKVRSMMTPRNEIVWLDINNSYKTISSKIANNPLSYYPVCRGTLDKIVGITRTEDLLNNFLVEGKVDLAKSLIKPLFLPENMQAFKALDLFKKKGVHTALILDEYGNVQGLISLNDLLEAIVGEFPLADELKDKKIIKRKDGSLIIDGLVSIEEFKDYLHIKKITGEKSGNFHTVGGLIIYILNRIPNTGNRFEWEGLLFEIIDMDGNRIDKVLVTKN